MTDLEQHVQAADLAELARLIAAIGLRLAALGASPRPEPLPVQTPPPARQLEGTDEEDDGGDTAARKSQPAAMSPEEFRRLRREWASMTQHEAARLFNVALRTIVRWEAGGTPINAFVADKARRVFVELGERSRIQGRAAQTVPDESVS